MIKLNFVFFIVSLLFITSVGQEINFSSLKNNMDSLAKSNLFSGSILAAADTTVLVFHSAGFENRSTNTPIKSSTKFELASITKSFTAVIILRLVEEKLVELQEPIAEYIKWYPNDTGKQINVHHLLAHQSGIKNYTNMPNWPQISNQNFSRREFVNLFADKPLEFEPGSQFAYSNSNYYLLGLIAEEVTGLSYEELLSKFIFKPANMTSSGVLKNKNVIKNLAIGYEKLPNGFIEKAPRQDYSTAFSVSGIYSTPFDLLRFSNAISNNLLLNEKSKVKLFSPDKKGYGYGFVISRINGNNFSDTFAEPFSDKSTNSAFSLTKIIWHWGSNPGYNTLFVKIPSYNTTLIILENITQLNSEKPTRIYDLAQAALLLLFDDCGE